ncbi:MAG: hypothetical protein INR73_21640 [Williamsia sp.]|nr:hypothetical protein [Williamsia sp.]
MATLASYSFLPWARQGIASGIAEKDSLGLNDGTAVERASLTATLELKHTSLKDTTHTSYISKKIQVIGPGDVLSFSRQNMVRTEPAQGITNFEANKLAYVEFYEEDFLWRYTPAGAESANLQKSRLRPWLTLLALKSDEYTLQSNGAGLSYINVLPGKFDEAFPHQNDSWAFAHVHMNYHLANAQGQALEDEVGQLLRNTHDLSVGRLLCARKLQKNTGYTAFLIPSFETGRLAGLGLDITGVKAQTPAWRKGSMPASDKRPFHFPVYHQWDFRTASLGDFENLASLIKPGLISPGTGKMPMDISHPGFGLNANGTRLIGMEAALRPPGMSSDDWPVNSSIKAPSDNLEGASNQETVEKLKDLLNLSPNLVSSGAGSTGNNPFFNTSLGDDPLLVPPVYGAWHAAVQQLGNGQNPPWVEQLNLDFRHRAAAGLGRQIVRKYQEDFVNRAWQQVDKVNEANKTIQQAALASMVNAVILKKHVINAQTDRTIQLTNPVQHLIINPQKKQTVQQDFTQSRIPQAAKSAAFRRITRPHGRVPGAHFTAPAVSSVRAGSARSLVGKAPAGTNIFQRFNADQSAPGALTAAKLIPSPSNSMQMNNLQDSLNGVFSSYMSNVPQMAKDGFLLLISSNITATPVQKAQLLQLASAQPGANQTIKTEIIDWVNNTVNFPLQRVNGQVIVQLTDAKFKAVFGDDVHAGSYNDVVLKDSQALTPGSIQGLSTLTDLQNLQKSINGLADKITKLPVAAQPQPLSALDAVTKHILSNIDPAVTMAKKLAATIKVCRNGEYLSLQQLKPVMAYPEFTESVYTYLLEWSKNYILPSIDKLPNETIALLENNQPFIEAFLAGMNHEMASELLWRAFPTDQRGSYFRQFWSVKDSIIPMSPEPEADKELQADIRQIETWKGKLGENSPKVKPANLVVVIRGTLLKKFPNAMIYMQQAMYDAANPAGPRKLKEGIAFGSTKFPVFKADIDPDITLMGFDLQAAEAKGEQLTGTTSPAGKNAGWFIVMKERPGQLSFGLDNYTDPQGNDTTMPAGAPATWNDLVWEHLVNKKEDLLTYHLGFNKTISITNSAGQPTWNSNAADLAAILFQNPVMIARHASEMLP